MTTTPEESTPSPPRRRPRTPRAAGSPPSTRRTQRERRDASRSAILTAARAEFMERGYSAVSLEDIVVRAGLTRGALYHQFADKAAVLEAVVHAEAATMQERLKVGLAGVDHPLERLRLGFPIYLDALDDVRVLRLIHVEYPAHCGAARATLDSPWLSYVEGLVADAIARRLLRAVDVRAMSRLILAFYRESLIAIAYAPDPDATRRQMSGALDAIVDGLRVDRPGHAART